MFDTDRDQAGGERHVITREITQTQAGLSVAATLALTCSAFLAAVGAGPGTRDPDWTRNAVDRAGAQAHLPADVPAIEGPILFVDDSILETREGVDLAGL